MVYSDLRAVEPGRRRLPLVLTNARNVVAYPCRALAQAGSASCSFTSTVRRRRRHRRLAREHDQPPGGYARRRAAASNGGRLSPASGETLFRIQAAAGQPGAEIGGSGNCGNLTTPGIEVRHAAGKTGSGNCENCGNRSGAGLERASAVMNTSNAPLMLPSTRQLETNDFWRKSSRRPGPLSKSMEIPFTPRLIPSESTPHRSDCHSRRAAI